MGCGSSVASVVQIAPRGAKESAPPRGSRPSLTRSDSDTSLREDGHGDTVSPLDLQRLDSKHLDTDADEFPDNISLASSAGYTVSTVVSGVTSLNSRAWVTGKGSLRSDDVHSDVPTIAESIADMQDLLELSSRAGDYHNFMSGASSFGPAHSNHGSFSEDYNGRPPGFSFDYGTVIDFRPHPLAPVQCLESMTEASRDANVADIGLLSDVPSFRDDASVSSAEEIFVMFPSTAHPSRSGCGDGAGTPTSNVSLRGQGKIPRNIHMALRESEARSRPRKPVRNDHQPFPGSLQRAGSNNSSLGVRSSNRSSTCSPLGRPSAGGSSSPHRGPSYGASGRRSHPSPSTFARDVSG